MIDQEMIIPTVEDINANHKALQPLIITTPVKQWEGMKDHDIDVWFKLELEQATGTFKARGALTAMRQLTQAQKSMGVVACSGGNHGIAVAWAAMQCNVVATVFVPEYINPLRLQKMREFNCNVEMVGDISKVFAHMTEHAESTGATVIHPFDGPAVTLGAGGVGLEIMQQIPDADAVIVAIGGGGLASGVGNAIKQINPDCEVYGVEPEKANSMYLSFKEGEPVSLPNGPKSIAVSLGSPLAEDYSFQICRDNLDDIVLISDQSMIEAMKIMSPLLATALEPAACASLAALMGPLRERLKGKKVVPIVCGSNMDQASYDKLMQLELG